VHFVGFLYFSRVFRIAYEEYKLFKHIMKNIDIFATFNKFDRGHVDEIDPIN
jgi:hypothetical protein